MIRQDVILDMTPGPNKPVVNVSQFDTGARVLVFHLRQDGESFTPPDGCTAIIHGIKPDETYFSYTAEIDGDTVIADCTEQMTAVPGFAECEIKITNTEGRVGSCNFRLAVEKSPETGAIISDTDIPLFEQLATRAEQAAAGATASATAASESAEQAGGSATDAGESADRAAREAETASQAAEEAGESAVSAAESASSASDSEASARGFAEQAEGFAGEASESAQGAAQAAQTASAKASEAAASADRASGSAVDSANAANLASGYADTAQAQAQAAGVSATNAAGSASTASQAAATATTKAGEASSSATAANTSAGQAASSASAASASAGTASEKATQAGESATNAANSASAAAGSASDASDSAAAALVSERAAAESASDIAASAAQIQTNTDNIAALQIIESTSAADITSIDDGADGVPMKSLKVYIEPVQSGSGDPSPDNIRPISGWDSVETVRTGKNLLNPNYEDYSQTNVYNYILNVVPNNMAARFTFTDKDTSVDVSGINIGFVKDKPASNVIIKNYRWAVSNGVIQSDTSNISAQGTNLRCGNVFIYQKTQAAFDALFARWNIMVELGSTATDYEPYQARTITTDLPSTVYGGVLDVISGELTVDRAMIASYAGETLPGEWISDRDVYSAGATPTTGAQVVYMLATPTTYTLTPEEVKTLLKANNIFADAGQTAIVYVADPKTYIDNSIADAVASLT